MRGRQEMGIYALIILLRLVHVAAGCGPPMGAAGIVAFLASRAIFFMAVNLSGVRVSYTVPGDSLQQWLCVQNCSENKTILII